MFCCLGIFSSFNGSLLSFLSRDAFGWFSLFPGNLVSIISFNTHTHTTHLLPASHHTCIPMTEHRKVNLKEWRQTKVPGPPLKVSRPLLRRVFKDETGIERWDRAAQRPHCTPVLFFFSSSSIISRYLPPWFCLLTLFSHTSHISLAFWLAPGRLPLIDRANLSVIFFVACEKVICYFQKIMHLQFSKSILLTCSSGAFSVTVFWACRQNRLKDIRWLMSLLHTRTHEDRHFLTQASI